MYNRRSWGARIILIESSVHYGNQPPPYQPQTSSHSVHTLYDYHRSEQTEDGTNADSDMGAVASLREDGEGRERGSARRDSLRAKLNVMCRVGPGTMPNIDQPYKTTGLSQLTTEYRARSEGMSLIAIMIMVTIIMTTIKHQLSESPPSTRKC